MMKHIVIAAVACFLALLPAACKKAEKNVNQREMGTISINVTPADAVLTIRNKHFAPGETAIPAGTYLLAAERSGYKTVWQKVVVVDKQTSIVNIEMEPVTATVLVTCNEDGAEVELAGHRGPAPLTVANLSHGTYDVTVSKSGFVPVKQQITVPFRPDRPDSPFVKRINLASNLGLLELNVQPADARVYIDDSENPVSASQRHQLTVGNHKVRVVREGYYEETTQVMIARNETSSLSFELREKPARLAILVADGKDAVVFLNDEEITSPEKWRELPAGKYPVKVSKNGYDTEEKNVTLLPGRDEKLIMDKMQRNTGIVYFRLPHPGIIISIDGKDIGASQPDGVGSAEEFKIAGLSVGETHTLSFRHPYQFIPFKKTFKIEERGVPKDLGKIEFRIANATLKFKNGNNRITGQVYVRDVSDTKVEVVIPAKSGTGAVYETVNRSELIITPLPAPAKNPRYNTSFVDMLGELDKVPETAEKATLRFNKLPIGTKVFVNDMEVGVAPGGVFELKHIPGSVKVAVFHKRAVGQTKRYEYPAKVQLNPGEVTNLPSPELWIPEYAAVYLKNGTSIKNCKLINEDPASPHIKIETSPADSMYIKRDLIAKKELYKD